MSTINDGGPAFPDVVLRASLRDYFAAEALHLFYWQRPDKVDDEQMQVTIARCAYSVADAMLAEREKGGGK